jgi:peptide-methionine (R)-S-oxide reductase
MQDGSFVMAHDRLILGAHWAAAAVVALAVAMTAAQDPFQVPEKPATSSTNKTDESPSKQKIETEFVRKTDAEWARILPGDVFMVTRRKATEPAFSGRFWTGHYRGTFICACCESELFSAKHKFDSGTGWPSFWQPIAQKALANAIDNSEAEQRMEVMCRRCGAHLGHVFNDGPPPTGLRYCINSLSLKLKPTSGDPVGTRATTKTKAKASAKSKTKAKTVPQTARSKGDSSAASGDGANPG